MTTRPGIVNFNLYAGATFSEEVVLRDGAGTPIDLTSRTARMQIRREIDDPTPLFDLDSEGANPGIVLGGAEGTIKFAIHPAAMSAVIVDWFGEMWVHDLLLTDTTTTPHTVDRQLQGRIIVSPGVTRP